MFDASNYWITVVELPSFLEAAEEILTGEEIEGMIAQVAQRPDDGTVIADTGGVRFLKWPECRRRRARVIYYFRDLNMPVYLLTVLSPAERFRLTKSEKVQMRTRVEELVREQWENQISPILSSNLRPIA